MSEEFKTMMLLEYGKLLKAGTVREHFEAKAAEFAEFSNSSNWRALKRAMLYLQAMRHEGDRSLTPLLAGFSDEG